MLPPHSRLDPEGLYTALGLDPAASAEAITAAFRRKARQLHPDVPVTGDAGRFIAVRQAYDVLSNRERRLAYDRLAVQSAADASLRSATHQAAPVPPVRPKRSAADPVDPPRYQEAVDTLRRHGALNLPIAAWVVLGAFLCICIIEAALHLRASPTVVSAGIKPNAAPVVPLPPGAQRAALYGPTPMHLPGTPNFYVTPSAGAAVIWKEDARLNTYEAVGQLPAFSTVQGLRIYRQTGLVEVLYKETTRFVDSRRLMRGDADAARRAYCSYNAGPPPADGETLELRGGGATRLLLENRAIQPAVVKLRDDSGAVILSVFLAPGSRTETRDVPQGTFRPEYAIGELWSRACNTFAAGMRARRLEASVTIPGTGLLVVPPENEAAATDISDQTFGGD